MQRKRKKNTYDESILWKLPRHESISCESSAFVVCKNALIRRDDITKNFYYNIALPEVLKYPSFSKVPFIFDFQEILTSISCRPKNFLYIVDVTVVLVALGTGSGCKIDAYTDKCLVKNTSLCSVCACTFSLLHEAFFFYLSRRVLYSWFGDYIKQQQKLKQ
uniref:Uncharacterized protein n=1 Tax=Glossina palpalis gambiensis TaxID=67801 RepID=A0A1B0AZ59_9MUSC